MQRNPDPEWRFLRRYRGDLRREGFGPPPGPPQGGPFGAGQPGGDPPGFQGRGSAVRAGPGGDRRFERFWFRTGGDIPIVGDFTAAWKKPADNGRWSARRPSPSPTTGSAAA